MSTTKKYDVHLMSELKSRAPRLFGIPTGVEGLDELSTLLKSKMGR